LPSRQCPDQIMQSTLVVNRRQAYSSALAMSSAELDSGRIV